MPDTRLDLNGVQNTLINQLFMEFTIVWLLPGNLSPFPASRIPRKTRVNSSETGQLETICPDCINSLNTLSQRKKECLAVHGWKNNYQALKYVHVSHHCDNNLQHCVEITAVQRLPHYQYETRENKHFIPTLLK